MKSTDDQRIITPSAQSATYYCPQLPLNIKIGEVYQGWVITKEDSPLTLLQKYYQHYFGQNYLIEQWNIFEAESVADKPNYSIISCCGSLEKEKIAICARKKIIHIHCELPGNFNKENFFTCED